MCGCAERQQRLNEMRPGLGDRVAVFAEPVKAALVAMWAWVVRWLR